MQDSNKFKEITTPNGHKILMRNYVSAKASREQQELLMADMKISDLEHIQDKLAAGDIPAITAMRSLDVLVKDVVKKVDGNESDAYNELLELPEADYTFVQAEVGKMRDSELEKKRSFRAIRRFYNTKARINEPLFDLIYLAELTGWDYFTIEKQPAWLVESMLYKHTMQRKAEDKANRKNSNSGKL